MSNAKDCLERFLSAVQDGRRGDYGKAKALVERVRIRFGDEAAINQRRELWNFIGSGK